MIVHQCLNLQCFFCVSDFYHLCVLCCPCDLVSAPLGCPPINKLDVDLTVNGLSSMTNLLRFALTMLCFGGGGVKCSILNTKCYALLSL